MKRNPGSVLISFIIIIMSLGGFLSFQNQNAIATNVSGLISTNTTWDLAGSPYIIVGDLTLANGATLVIEPGVEVRFDGYYIMIINGSLYSVGTEFDRINITSNDLTPSAGDWDKIQVNPAAHIEIRYSDINYGGYGIFINGSNYNNITENRLFNNGIALEDSGGLHLISSLNNTITNNSIYSNDRTGIYLEQSSNNSIKNNNIYSTKNCIDILNSSNNIFENNNLSCWQVGLSLKNSQLNNIKGNDVRGSWIGIDLDLSPNNTIVGNKIRYNERPIIVESLSNGTIIINNTFQNNVASVDIKSSNNYIFNNSISLHDHGGFYFFESKNNYIAQNDFSLSGIIIYGDQVSHFNTHTILDDNIINGRPLYYYKNCSGLEINNITVGQLILANCTNAKLANIQASSTYVGIEIAFTSNTTIANNSILSNNKYGIFLVSSSRNTIIRNELLSNDYGGIHLRLSSNNNSLIENTISNSEYGLRIEKSNENRIYHNNFINNIYQASLWQSTNIWNDTYPSGGNYWSDYSPTCLDFYDGETTPQFGGEPDGICDTPYTTTVIDYYPLKSIWEPSSQLIDTTSPIADAGADQDGVIGDTINFDGSASSDNIDGIDQLNFTWKITKDGDLISTLYGINPSFAFTAQGEYDINLTVRDTSGNEGYDTLIVTIVILDKPKDFLTEYWWVLLIITVLLILGMALFLMIRKKKPEGIAEVEETIPKSKEGTQEE